jgi:large subunit ribosomal protein L14
MIQKGSYLNVIDNSGAKEVCCIRVTGGYQKRYASIGDIIIVSIKSLRNKRRSLLKIKKGEVLRAVIVRTKKPKSLHKSTNLISFNENSAVLLSLQNKIIGTRVFGSVPKQLNYTKFLKLVSISSGFCY